MPTRQIAAFVKIELIIWCHHQIFSSLSHTHNVSVIFLLWWIFFLGVRCRTIAVETGFQNGQLCNTIIQLSFSPAELELMYAFPVIYSVVQLALSILFVGGERQTVPMWKRAILWCSAAFLDTWFWRESVCDLSECDKGTYWYYAISQLSQLCSCIMKYAERPLTCSEPMDNVQCSWQYDM